jgi:hypothetical protein
MAAHNEETSLPLFSIRNLAGDEKGKNGPSPPGEEVIRYEDLRLALEVSTAVKESISKMFPVNGLGVRARTHQLFIVIDIFLSRGMRPLVPGVSIGVRGMPFGSGLLLSSLQHFSEELPLKGYQSYLYDWSRKFQHTHNWPQKIMYTEVEGVVAASVNLSSGCFPLATALADQTFGRALPARINLDSSQQANDQKAWTVTRWVSGCRNQHGTFREPTPTVSCLRKILLEGQYSLHDAVHKSTIMGILRNSDFRQSRIASMWGRELEEPWQLNCSVISKGERHYA